MDISVCVCVCVCVCGGRRGGVYLFCFDTQCDEVDCTECTVRVMRWDVQSLLSV